MFRNYLKTAFRNLKRNKSYAFINILGLSIGIAACLLIFLVLQFETSFDTFHKNKERIYRLVSEYHNPDGVGYSEGVPFPTGRTLRNDYPQLEKVASIFAGRNVLISVPQNGDFNNAKKFREKSGFFYAEPEFFDMFNFPFLQGNAKTALSEPNAVVLTQEAADRYFGDWKKAIGQSIKYNSTTTFKVTGILKNVPVNTDFPLKIVASYKSSRDAQSSDWVSTWSDSYVFVQTPAAMSAKQLNASLKATVKKYKPAEYAKDGIASQPFREMHFDNRMGNFNNHVFSKDLIMALTVIGIFLLIIACVNFVNLATAQAVNRSKEVGVRKVMGGQRIQLGLQFISETAVITFIALLIAVGLAFVCLPLLNQLLQIHISLHFSPMIVLFLAGVAVLTTLLSGFYPAIVLSKFNPIAALKSKVNAKMIGGISLRRGLVILQFTIAHVLIIGTLIVVSQMDYFRNADLGFDKEAIITVGIPGDSLSNTRINYLRDQFSKYPGIENVTFSFASPSDNSNWNSDFRYDHATKSTDFGANLKWADANYFKTYKLAFVAGRPYYESDTVREFVVNETLVKKLGVRNPQDVLGKEINFWDGVKKGVIVGVVKDFHANSLRDKMSPVILGTWRNVYSSIGIKIKAGQLKPTMAYIESLWTKAFPDYLYEYQFLDEKIANFYRQESQLSALYKIFAGIAILISCLGLYGLISFMAVQRTKEVGIRKVLGASIGNIVYMFSKEFTLLILIAFVIAAPLAWFFTHKWLQDFEYRVNVGVGIFLLAIVSSIVLAWVTVGYRAVRAALANPVKSLRSE
jgi:putative ABC transport system permease protein